LPKELPALSDFMAEGGVSRSHINQVSVADGHRQRLCFQPSSR